VPLEEVVDDLLDGADEAGYVAFPTSEHESRYEDEPEEVYADFSVIFGGGGGRGGGDDSDEEGASARSGAGGDGEHFEDYMDDLDGIPWTIRC
jgi:hypothetical protein